VYRYIVIGHRCIQLFDIALFSGEGNMSANERRPDATCVMTDVCEYRYIEYRLQKVLHAAELSCIGFPLWYIPHTFLYKCTLPCTHIKIAFADVHVLGRQHIVVQFDNIKLLHRVLRVALHVFNCVFHLLFGRFAVRDCLRTSGASFDWQCSRGR
jgi:hypothetical protein